MAGGLACMGGREAPVQVGLVEREPACSRRRCTRLLQLELHVVVLVVCPVTLQELMAAELARTGQMGEAAAAGAEALAF